SGEVDDAPPWLRVWPTVGDLDLGLLPGLEIFHHHLGTEREGTMGGGLFLLGEALAVGGLAPVKLLPIPGCLPPLCVLRSRVPLPARKHQLRADPYHNVLYSRSVSCY